MKLIVKSTYEAAYYIVLGARIDKIVFRKNPENVHLRRRKKGLRLGIMYIFTMSSVPEEAVKEWHEGSAMVNAKEFMYARLKIKKIVEKQRNAYELQFQT